MRKILIACLLVWTSRLVLGQGSYYHDPTLDTIVSAVNLVNDTLLDQTNKPDLLTHSNVIADSQLVFSNNLYDVTNRLVPAAVAASSNLVGGVMFPFNDYRINLEGLTNYEDQNSHFFWDRPPADVDYIQIGKVLDGFEGDFYVDKSDPAFSWQMNPASVVEHYYDTLTVPGTPAGALLNSVAFPSFQVCRLIAIGLAYLWFYLSAVAYIQESFGLVMSQPQVKGSNQSALGTNVSAPSGLAYATIVTTAIIGVVASVSLVSLPTAFASWGAIKDTVMGFGMNGFGTQTDALQTSMPAWVFSTAISVLTMGYPIFQLFGIWLSFYMWKYFMCWPSFQLVRALIFWLIV